VTLQLRPTFSESWYRVKTLKVKLRPGAQISRQHYRGERWYVVRDPAGNQFHRLSDPAYRFVGLLDGTRTVEEAWDLCGGQLADDSPTQPEVIQILSHLFSANLIDADVTPDATVLLRRHKQLNKRKFQNRLMNVLFPRIPLWDPDRFLVRWMPLVRNLFSKFGALVWLAVVISACVMVANKSRDPSHNLTEAAKHAIDVHTNTVNLILLWGVFVFVKLIHELGHAFGCRRFGGECHELGIMFLVFIPTPYVDASTAWGFPNKWQRIFVGAGGMIVELFFASICAFIWCNVGTPNTNLLGQLAFNAMLVASVTTIMFNANPLLRYDGYYILSDFLEIPNLRQKSTEYALGLLKRHVFRVKQQQPLPPPVQRFWLFIYAVASSIYRVFVGVLIILLVAFQIPILGVLMALGGVVTWICVPIFKTFKYLAIEPELHRKRGRATAFTLAVVAAAVVVIGLIPWKVNVYAQGIIEPTEREVVYATERGYVTDILVKDGQEVKPGDIILISKSDELDAEIKKAKAELAAHQVELNRAISRNESVESVRQDIARVQNELKEMAARHDALTIRASIAGRIVAPELKYLKDQFIGPSKKEIAMIQSTDHLTVVIALPQDEAQLVPGYEKMVAAEKHALATHEYQNVDINGVQTEIRTASDEGTIIPINSTLRSNGMAIAELRHPSLGQPAGGEIAVSQEDPKKAVTPVRYVEVPLQNPNGDIVPWQRAHVRLTVDRKPLVWQWSRRFWQVIQEHAAGSKWL
jgi:putative peptide zinc metalloprotease protein